MLGLIMIVAVAFASILTTVPFYFAGNEKLPSRFTTEFILSEAMGRILSGGMFLQRR